ncbi:MAG: hypothetical protein HY078_07000 [Elusimicrobia bacterium]|nr:hypothetical protein [Elusimicrobiota bacterium]
MRALVAAASAAAVLAAASVRGAEPKAPAPAGEDTIKMVKFFTSHPVSELPSTAVPAFLDVDALSLPKGLRDKFTARREELLAMKSELEGKSKPLIRRMGVEPPPKDKCKPLEGSTILAALAWAKFKPITTDEKEFLESETNCSECELVVEFSLRKVVNPKPKGKRDVMLYFLHEKDSLWTLVEVFRTGRKSPRGTEFFGMSIQSKCK